MARQSDGRDARAEAGLNQSHCVVLGPRWALVATTPIHACKQQAAMVPPFIQVQDVCMSRRATIVAPHTA